MHAPQQPFPHSTCSLVPEKVVMEYLDHNDAKLLQNLFDINPPMDWREKRAITKHLGVINWLVCL